MWIDNIRGNLYTPVVLAHAFILIFFKNSIELKEKFIPNNKHLIFTIAILFFSIFNLNKVSEFLYFNF
jgi:hypothetical protein